MFNIYDMMKDGISADEIAATFAKSLNDAEARIKAEEAEEARLAEEAARAEAERVAAENAKIVDFTCATREFMHAVAKHYPELGFQEDEITEDSAAAIAALVVMSLDLEAMRGRHTLHLKVKTNGDKTATVKEVPVDPFATFFKQFGL